MRASKRLSPAKNLAAARSPRGWLRRDEAHHFRTERSASPGVMATPICAVASAAPRAPRPSDRVFRARCAAVLSGAPRSLRAVLMHLHQNYVRTLWSLFLV